MLWNEDANKAFNPNSKKKFHPIKPNIKKYTAFCPAALAIGRIFPEKMLNAAIENNNVLITGTDNDVNKITELLVGLTNPLITNDMNEIARNNLIITTRILPQDRLANVPEKIVSVEAKIKNGRTIKAAINSALTSFL